MQNISSDQPALAFSIHAKNTYWALTIYQLLFQAPEMQ